MNRKAEISVGLFLIIVICSVLFLLFRVADTTTINNKSTYRVYAVFDNVGGLKARSPIKIGGVVIGRVANISLDKNNNYKPYVTIDIESGYDTIPSSSSLSIKTSGLLGEQFIDIAMGIDNGTISEIDALDALDFLDTDDRTSDFITKTPAYFEEGFVTQNTKPAMVIEDLIGQFLYSSGSDNKTATTQHSQ